MSAGASALAEFERRAALRLRLAPPDVTGPRSDLAGDLSLDPVRHRLPATPPRLAAVLIPVVAHPDEPTILFTERAATLRQHSGQIALPGGRIDPDDASPIAAAIREAEEEVGLPADRIRPLGYLDPYLSATNYLVLPVVAIVRPGFRLRLNPAEVQAAFEVPLAFLMDETSHELLAREWHEGVRQYYAMPFEDRYIWGVTAGILRNMYERLYGP